MSTMWMLLGPSFIPVLFDAGPFVSALVLAVWCGDEDGTGLDLRVVGGGDGFMLVVTSR